ncbi:CHAD domain-containing protein [Streptomyces marinisediminis]|uniref:CHAD domain-containing protein n=1 Tax=Streptomyces TaxID=1883 RepID=UPI003A4C555D
MAPRHDLTAGGAPVSTDSPRALVPHAAGEADPPPRHQPGPFHPAGTAGEVLAGYLHHQAGEVLRALRQHAETAGSAETAADAAEAVRLMRRAARRISGTLHTFRRLLDPAWADHLATELTWLCDLLGREYDYATRLDRLLTALHRLSAPGEGTAVSGTPGRPGVGAARAGALLERQLTLLRTRAHSAALQALGSGRFHAVADAVALLASEVPLATEPPASADTAAPRGADGSAAPFAADGSATPFAADGSAAALPGLRPCLEHAHRRLTDAVDALPLGPGALAHTLTGSADRYDGAWHHVRLLLRHLRYAQEVLGEESGVLGTAARHLHRHRTAAEAAAAAASAGRTPRIAPATAYALGVLHADQRHEVEAARLAFCRVWHPPSGPGHAPAHP